MMRSMSRHFSVSRGHSDLTRHVQNRAQVGLSARQDYSFALKVVQALHDVFPTTTRSHSTVLISRKLPTNLEKHYNPITDSRNQSKWYENTTCGTCCIDDAGTCPACGNQAHDLRDHQNRNRHPRKTWLIKRNRFSHLTSSTLRLRLRPESTS